MTEIVRLADAVRNEFLALQQLGLVNTQEEINEAYEAADGPSANSRCMSRALNIDDDQLGIAGRQELLTFLQTCHCRYRAIFWAVSPDLDNQIWDNAQFHFRLSGIKNGNRVVGKGLQIVAKGLFRNDTDDKIHCKGTARLFDDGHLEWELLQTKATGRKSYFIGCFERIGFDHAPNLGLIIGHYLAISGSHKAGYPITSRPMLLFPANTPEPTVEIYKEWMLGLKGDSDLWWRKKTTDWLAELNQLPKTATIP
ncbi:MAG: hypothetical protein JNJ57_13420 [Saprospiraceae bacterium]|nr:hypothetical protein [Saprospiraceae bacterium]